VTWYPSTFAGYTGEWDAKAQVGAAEWTCELRIKLDDLFGRPVGGDQQLYVNFTRQALLDRLREQCAGRRPFGAQLMLRGNPGHHSGQQHRSGEFHRRAAPRGPGSGHRAP